MYRRTVLSLGPFALAGCIGGIGVSGDDGDDDPGRFEEGEYYVPTSTVDDPPEERKIIDAEAIRDTEVLYEIVRRTVEEDLGTARVDEDEFDAIVNALEAAERPGETGYYVEYDDTILRVTLVQPDE